MEKPKPKPGRTQEQDDRTGEKHCREAACPSSDAVEKLIEDLRVHQVELETQNEQLRQAQETIEESRLQYSDLYDYAPVGYFTFDAKGLILKANLTAASLLGAARGLLTGKPFAKFLASEDRDTFYLHRAGVMQSGTKQTCELKIRRDGGDIMYGLMESVPVKSREFETPSLLSTLTDITERKRAEQEIMHLASAMREVGEGVCILGLDGKILYCNPSFSGITGHSEEELRRKGSAILDTGEHEKPLHTIVKESIKTGHSWSGRVTSRKKDGTPFPHDVTLSPVRDNSGKVRNFVMVTRDMTEHEILEQQLRQAQKMEAIGTLAGGIAHDFNNILAAILGFTEMAIEDTPDRPAVQKSLGNVLKSTVRARELVKQILAFSRKTGYVRSPVSISGLIKETVDLLRASIPATVEVKLALGASSDTILAAPVEVQQILMNLATNAALAMEGARGTLEISLVDTSFKPDLPVLEPDVIPGDYVQLVVRDTGVGVSPDVMGRIFEPFFTTRGVGEGTGMGLSVVYGIVKNLHGMITVESEVGKGSTFRVSLPKMKTELIGEKPRSAPALGGKERILFVDDEDMLVEWGRVTLERLGYSVLAMTDSEEALNTFSSAPSRFDLVITDQTMPSMTGVQFAGELHKIRPGIPIILCTGHSDTLSSETVCEAGIKQFLSKPVAKQELAQAVRRVLDSENAEDEKVRR